jgi:hypothetical protein
MGKPRHSGNGSGFATAAQQDECAKTAEQGCTGLGKKPGDTGETGKGRVAGRAAAWPVSFEGSLAAWATKQVERRPGGRGRHAASIRASGWQAQRDPRLAALQSSPRTRVQGRGELRSPSGRRQPPGARPGRPAGRVSADARISPVLRPAAPAPSAASAPATP